MQLVDSFITSCIAGEEVIDGWFVILRSWQLEMKKAEETRLARSMAVDLHLGYQYRWKHLGHLEWIAGL